MNPTHYVGGQRSAEEGCIVYSSRCNMPFHGKGVGECTCVVYPSQQRYDCKHFPIQGQVPLSIPCPSVVPLLPLNQVIHPDRGISDIALPQLRAGVQPRSRGAISRRASDISIDVNRPGCLETSKHFRQDACIA